MYHLLAAGRSADSGSISFWNTSSVISLAATSTLHPSQQFSCIYKGGLQRTSDPDSTHPPSLPDCADYKPCSQGNKSFRKTPSLY